MPASRQSHGSQPNPDLEPEYPTSVVNDVLVAAGLPPITYAEIHQVLDAEGIPREERRHQVIQAFVTNMDQTGLAPIGLKPEATSQRETDIFMVSIPQDHLCIRLFPGGTRPEAGMFFFDFYDARRQVAVNAPPGYAVTIVWPGGLAGPITSVEATMGVTPDEGLEKFAVVERVRCSLARPRQEPYLFDIPSRTRPEAGVQVGQAVRIQ